MRMKKKRHGGERLSLLSALTTQNPSELVKNVEAEYANSNPLRIEIGCGKGDFVRGKSVQEKDYNYLAIEKIADVCTLAVENYATSRGLGNLAPNGGWMTPDGVKYPLGGDSVPFTDEQRISDYDYSTFRIKRRRKIRKRNESGRDASYL